MRSFREKLGAESGIREFGYGTEEFGDWFTKSFSRLSELAMKESPLAARNSGQLESDQQKDRLPIALKSSRVPN